MQAYGKLEKVWFFTKSLIVSNELYYPKHKDFLLTALDRVVPAGSKANIFKARVDLINYKVYSLDR